jgi:hypothetical protein
LDERLTLRKNLVGIQAVHLNKKDIYYTVPRMPTILASTCRRWRSIALNMSPLWSFLRVPTLEQYSHYPTRACVVGLSTFQRAKLCIGASKCEVVVGPTTDWSMVIEHLQSIPISQISTLNIVLPRDRLDLSQIPTARVLRIFGRESNNPWNPPPFYSLPTFVLAATRELDCHHALLAVNAPILSVTSFSLNFNSSRFPDLGHWLTNFPNLTTVVLSAFHTPEFQRTHTALHHSYIKTLSITSTIIVHLCASLERGALSLPSLTHFILLDICRSSSSEVNWGRLQSLFVNVTCFDIRAVSEPHFVSNIRQLLDAMPRLQQFTVFGNAVDDGLGALLIAPIKRIGKLVVSDSKTDGSIVTSYYGALKSSSADRPEDKLDLTIQFINCPCILPRVREQLS